MKRIILDEYADWPEDIVLKCDYSYNDTWSLPAIVLYRRFLIEVSFPDRKENPFFRLYKEAKK